MQVGTVDILFVLVVGSIVLLAFAVAYIVMMAYSHRRLAETQRAKLEEVRKSEEKFRSLFDNSLAGIMKFSADTWAISDANEAIMELCGCSSLQELQSCMSNLPGTSLEFIRDCLMAYGFIAEHEIRTTRKDGAELWILFSAKKMENDPSVQAVVVDITRRKQFEEKIREQGALLDQTLDAIIVVDYHGTVTFWNSGAELMYGWSREEISGHAMEELLYSSQRRKDFHEAMEDIGRFKEWNGEHYHTRKDGKEILVESRWRTVRKGFNGTTEILIVNSDITEKKRLEA
ncbi:MAG: PAS domain-containing protein, partial [Ignavibacteriales bacterium]|nr:PAS domain-containing protein [Ignavibacteriales bacterium]